VVSRLPGYTRGTLIAAITPRKGMTPYAWWGNLAAWIAAAALFAWGMRRRA
jgi:apolipoprotein N-acyltransferase